VFHDHGGKSADRPTRDNALFGTAIYGEPAGIRTRDLLIKSQLLYRLSYRLTSCER
jgi:hypothetical protein